MAIEIERKFLVANDSWKAHVAGTRRIRQAYLARPGKSSIRVRIVDDAKATLTIKSRGARLARHEFEYPVPVADALTLLELRDGFLISKVRHLVPHDGMTWEIDVFDGDNAGLVIAEVELNCELQHLTLPPWVGREVTQEEMYSNSSLAHRPYSFVREPMPQRAAGF